VKEFEIKIEDAFKRLEKELGQVSEALEKEIYNAVRGLARSTFAEIQAKAYEQLNRTRQDYIKALDYQEIDEGVFLISLEGTWPNMLEDGFQPFRMGPGLLASKKMVQVGSRKNQPWVQHSKPTKDSPSHKFAYVPIEHQPTAKAGNASNLADAIKNITATNLKGQQQAITKLFKGDDGRALEGRVARADPKSVTDDRLAGLVKYQKRYTKNGRDTIQSIYVTYRTVSELSPGWIHPGFDGVQAFEGIEQRLQKQIDQIINSLF
jgi:hypothetical protein